MAIQTSAELGTIFECDLSAGGLDEFEPEAERGAMWRRVATPTATDLLRWEPYVAPPARGSWPFVMPVAIAAVIAGAGVSWLGLRPVQSPTAPASPLVVARQIAAADPTPTAPLVAEPLTQSAVIAAAVPAVAPVPAPMEPAFAATLAAVSRSYRELDPAMLTTVWPGADTASLEQSFSTLKYQSLSFERCETRQNGPEGVLASCNVSIAAAPKSGQPALERRRESWTLVLDRSGDRWTIGGVSVRAGVVSEAAIP